MYTVEKQSENCTGGGSDMQKHTYGLSDVRMQKSIACEVWSFDTHSQDMDACYLSPWKILQCYLESTLQVTPSLTNTLLTWKFKADSLPCIEFMDFLLIPCRLELSMN